MANALVSGPSGEALVVIEPTLKGEMDPHGEGHARKLVKWLARIFVSIESLPPGASCLYHARFQEKLLELFMQLIEEMRATFSRIVQVASEEEVGELMEEFARDHHATMARVRALEAQLEEPDDQGEDVGEEEEDTGDEGSDEEMPDEGDSDSRPAIDIDEELARIFGDAEGNGGEEEDES